MESLERIGQTELKYRFPRNGLKIVEKKKKKGTLEPLSKHFSKVENYQRFVGKVVNAIMRSKRSYHDFTGWIWVMFFLTRQTTISRLIPGSVYKFPSAQSAVARDTRAFWRPKRFPESFPREWWKRDWIWQNCGFLSFFFLFSVLNNIFIHFLNILDAGKLIRWYFFFLEGKLEFYLYGSDNVSIC